MTVRNFILHLPTVFTIIFSFGQNISIFKLIPMIGTLVPGRILSMSSITAAVAGAYIVNTIQHIPFKRKYLKILPAAVNIAVIVLVISDMNPYKTTFSTMNYDAYFEEYMPYLQGEGKAFDKGRYEWIAPVNSAETYFATIKYGYNTSDGWNIEGTPHNRNIWNYNIALVSGANKLQRLVILNVRSVYTPPDGQRRWRPLSTALNFQSKAKNTAEGRFIYTLTRLNFIFNGSGGLPLLGQSAGPVALNSLWYFIPRRILKLDINELQGINNLWLTHPKTLSHGMELKRLF